MNLSLRLACLGLLFLFVLVRLPGLSSPYQQDEFKTAVVAETSLAAASTFLSHPPLTAIFLRADAVIFGGTHMRVLPLLFGLVSALLLFLVVRRRFDDTAALFALGAYSIAFYGVWASLMVDTDGAILPTFFLVAVYAYDCLRVSVGRQRVLWGSLLVAALVAGLLTKLSFILVVGALLVDSALSYRHTVTRRQLWYAVASLVGFVALAGLAFLTLHLLNPDFQAAEMFAHARSYVRFSGRNYTQVAVEGIKALLYLSPLLIAPLFLGTRELFGRARVFVIYLALGAFFYFVLFDFSRGALDKYLMYAIVPLAVLAGAIGARYLARPPSRLLLAGGALVAFFLLILNFLPQEAMGLYPKSAWFARFFMLDWTFLTPFNGGSGPAGFYVSFLFIAACFGVAFGAIALALARPALAHSALWFLLVAGISYNGIFFEEFSWGGMNGSVAGVLDSSLAFITTLDPATRVLTYNDIGAYELRHAGYYAGRFYAAPQFETAHRVLFPAHAAADGVFFVVGIPPLYKGFYTDYLKECSILFTTHSRAISGTVYGLCAPKNP